MRREEEAEDSDTDDGEVMRREEEAEDSDTDDEEGEEEREENSRRPVDSILDAVLTVSPNRQ